jgi:dephospho-CoA kinase
MGKSAAGEWLGSRGIPVVDTDILAHQLVEPGQPALTAIRNLFGNEVIASDGTLLRDRLATIVFADAAGRKRLQDILHPRIAELWRQQIESWRDEGKSSAVVVIPLLFETGCESEFDAVVCVACLAVTQRQRLASRGWSPAEVSRRIDAQLPIELKIARSDHVVWNEGSLDVIGAQLSRIFLPSNASV